MSHTPGLKVFVAFCGRCSAQTGWSTYDRDNRRYTRKWVLKQLQKGRVVSWTDPAKYPAICHCRREAKGEQS